MKPTSPLSLLLFLSLTTASPIPTKLPKDCLHYTTCQPWLREIFSPFLPSKNDHTPATRLSTPHFPAHQLYSPSSSAESHRLIEEEFNNSPLAPPSELKPDTALSANRPLQSTYLLSLSSPAIKNPPQAGPESPSSTEALPSKPTSALPKLRKEDALRYWATIAFAEKKEDEGGPVRKCGSAYLRVGQPMVMAREYSDLLVVGIVVLFLAAVVVVEALEYFSDLRSAISTSRSRRQRRGEIFLKNDEEVAFIVEKPFVLQAAPTKFTTSLSPVREMADGEEALCRD